MRGAEKYTRDEGGERPTKLDPRPGNNAAGRGRNKNMSYQGNAISRVNREIKGEAYTGQL